MEADPERGRRRFLAVGAGALGAAIAGCVGGRAERPLLGERTPAADGGRASSTGLPDTRRTDGSDTRRTDEDGGRTSPGGAPGTTTSAGDEPGAEESVDQLRLPSLTAPGSPGGPIAVVPPGKVVLLDFFATWCGPCEPEMVHLRAVRRRFDRANVFVVSLTQETDQRTVVRWWEENRGTWPVVVDPTLTATQEYGVTGLPTIVVLGRDGTETFRHVGLAGEERLTTAIEEALGAGATAGSERS